MARRKGGVMAEHICAQKKYCICSIGALEPDDNCPLHGHANNPPKCDTCGRFIKRTLAEGAVNE
jgi:hypothetical protein